MQLLLLVKSSGSKSFLLYGDLSGSVAVFTFHKPLSGLFCGSNKDGDCDKPFLIAHGVSQSSVVNIASTLYQVACQF